MKQRFAIVGMDCVLPGSGDAEAWIRNSRSGQPVVGPVPEGRWPVDPASHVDTRVGVADRTSTTVGGFVEGFRFDPTGLDLDLPAERMDPLVQWVLHTCRGALGTAKVKRAATDVVLANLSLPSTGAVRAAAGPYRQAAALDTPWLDDDEPLDRWQSGLPAQLAARALGLGGAAFALDSACASSLYAVRIACDRLANGLCDAAIAAGVQRADSSYLFFGFSQLRALSPTGQPRPLDARADGLCVGEGAAAVLIKRLDDALHDGDTIHAVLHGGGLGNDGQGGNLLAPRSEGQLRTLQTAWAGIDAKLGDLGYVECHATGTQLGDTTELDALEQLVGKRKNPVVLSSTKGIVGHTITVAGLAGLIRAVGSVRDGWLPATPWASEPMPKVEQGGFELLAEPRRWKGRRIAAVSAFGFGGTNAHLVVEAAPAKSKKPRGKAKRPKPIDPRIAVVGIAARIGAAESLPDIATVLRGRGSLRTEAPVSATRGLGHLPQGAWVDAVTADARALKIPPTELQNVLPQQLLMLVTAARALADAPTVDPTRTASVVGMGIDLHVAEQVLRWCAADEAHADAVAPVLTASRVQGSLPNFCANRIAASFGLQGPSLTVSAEEASGLVAVELASRLLASGEVDAALAGAVDLPGQIGAHAAARLFGDAAPAEGAVALVLKRRDDAIADGDRIYAVLRGFGHGEASQDAQQRALREADRSASSVAAVCVADRAPKLDLGPTTAVATHREALGHGEALDGAVSLLQGIVAANLPPGETALGWAEAGRVAAAHATGRAGTHVHVVIESPEAEHRRPIEATAPASPAHPVRVPHSGPPVRVVNTGWFDYGPAPEPVQLRGAKPADVPMTWFGGAAHSSQQAPPDTRHPKPETPPTPDTRHPTPHGHPAPDTGSLTSIVHALERSTATMVAAHQQFLAMEQDAHEQIRQIGLLAASLVDPTAAQQLRTRPAAPRPTRPVLPPAPVPESAPPHTSAHTPNTRHPTPDTRPTPATPPSPDTLFDLPALEAFAAGPLSSCLGPTYADLDKHEPRVRLPMHPLLLVSRITELEGTRGELGPSRIVTEYDLDPDAVWADRGKPPPSVVVESGQADLFLVSVLGIDELCRGERLYRLLDCDLTFHGDRPMCGETLRHDIRIKRFARLGGTTLFYFEYDAISKTDGRPVLTMRNGCAGFFTEAELATPQGCDCSPSNEKYTGPLLGALPGGSRNLRRDDIAALSAGTQLDLPKGDWRLVHEVSDLQLQGGLHGLGGLRAVQHLRDDDWFNACHFKGDPCMPGTLMFDGCTQALQVWLLATGVGKHYPDATFEPLDEIPVQLRCRGQVVPGHSELVYEVRVKDARLDHEPFARADVILHVDGIAVVRAEDVGVRIVGERVEVEQVVEQEVAAPELPDRTHFLNHAVGSHETAFGPAVRHFDTERRGPRIPGPPLQFVHRAQRVDSPVGQLQTPASAVVAYDVPEDAWYWRANPGVSMPFAVFLETALQPCGWFTAWQGCAARSDRDLYFRNLGGSIELFEEVLPSTGELQTTATLTQVSESAGMVLTFFTLEVHAGERLVAKGDTHFGYFTKSALAGQSGLPDADALPIPKPNLAKPIDLSEWSGGGAPRADARMLDRIVHVDEAAGVYVAELDVDPDAWFFTAHFHEDPVMPGSLGLEALTQLARWALLDGGRLRSLSRRIQPVLLDREMSWKYRGQVLRPVKKVTAVFEITERLTEAGAIVGRGTIYADDLPIYRFDDFGVCTVKQGVKREHEPAWPERPTALLDSFTVDGDTGHGTLKLDPERHPWLRDHCPTLVIPAVPMAFAAEIAAEAALQLRPTKTVIGLPELEAKKWLHGSDGHDEVVITAVAQGDTVAVTLFKYVENRRYSQLSGLVEHMRAVVQLGDSYPAAPAAPQPLEDAKPVELSADDYYEDGHTFHGFVLRGMTDLGRRSSKGAEARFTTRDDDMLVPAAPTFVLDPLLLDCATHPMMSSTPELWVDGLAPGKLAYPVNAQNLVFYGPRPRGEVDCRLDLVEATPHTLVFDVTLHQRGAVWCTFRWAEALVDGGLLGAPAEVIADFCVDGRPMDVEIPLVEPLEGTLVRLLGRPFEQEAWQRADARKEWLASWLAAKQRVREHVRTELGRDLHPRNIGIVELAEGWAVTEAPDLTAEEFVRVLHPTKQRF